jgi:16S rRNA (cytosine967-C5)-methyltransferase
MLHTARCVAAVAHGQSLSEALPAVSDALRPGVQALTFHALRHLGLARAVAARLVQRNPEPLVHALLCTAIALLTTDDGPRYAEHTVVDQAVAALRRQRRTERQAGFVNACLRRFLRERATLLDLVRDDPVARYNHPQWWIERLRRDYPQHWPAILAADNEPGPLTLRVNRRQTSRDDYLQSLADAGIAARPVGEDGVVLARAVPVDQLPGFAQGQVSVQDEAAQLAAPLLLAGRDWTSADRVLDACAAPGGKTAHLLERADVQVLALDVDAQRARRINDTLQRLGLKAQVLTADAAHPEKWWDGQPFDAILLDAPCSAAGIVRRHPDVRWLRRDSDIAALVAIQKTLLEALWPLLKPGGRLIYATCSVFKAEGEDQVQAFLSRHTDARWQPSPGHLLPGRASVSGEFNDNALGGHDGFFYARLDKALP